MVSPEQSHHTSAQPAGRSGCKETQPNSKPQCDATHNMIGFQSQDEARDLPPAEAQTLASRVSPAGQRDSQFLRTLREACQQASLTQVEVARKLGHPQSGACPEPSSEGWSPVDSIGVLKADRGVSKSPGLGCRMNLRHANQVSVGWMWSSLVRSLILFHLLPGSFCRQRVIAADNAGSSILEATSESIAG